MKNDIVVYEHFKPETGEVFYVGIGTPRRPYQTRNRNRFWLRTVAKHGISIRIICKNLSWELACKIEIALIEEYGRRDLNIGTLVNLTDGGDGALGFKHSKEAKERLSQVGIGNTNAKGSKARSRKLIDTATGIVYPSVQAAAEVVGCHKVTLGYRISGKYKTPTTFKYI